MQIQDIKQYFKDIDLDPLTKIDILVLKGIISGDGDIGGRMASSSAAAKPPVSESRMKFLAALAEKHRELGTPLSELDSIHGSPEK